MPKTANGNRPVTGAEPITQKPEGPEGGPGGRNEKGITRCYNREKLTKRIRTTAQRNMKKKKGPEEPPNTDSPSWQKSGKITRETGITQKKTRGPVVRQKVFKKRKRRKKGLPADSLERRREKKKGFEKQIPGLTTPHQRKNEHSNETDRDCQKLESRETERKKKKLLMKKQGTWAYVKNNIRKKNVKTVRSN